MYVALKFFARIQRTPLFQTLDPPMLLVKKLEQNYLFTGVVSVTLSFHMMWGGSQWPLFNHLWVKAQGDAHYCTL